MSDKHKQDASGLYIDSVGGRVTTTEDLVLFDQGADLLATMQAPRFLSANDPHERVYYVCFDGTGNDVDKDPQHATNVATLKEQLEEIRDNSDDRVAVGYISGPGTQKNPATRTWDGARGYTFEERIVDRYQRLQAQVERWQHEDPDVKVRVVVVGFSRGAEQAAGFTRLLDEVGIQDRRDNKIRYENNHWVGNPTHPPLIAPGQTPQAVALFDPVATGIPMQFDRRLPPSVVSGIQLTSRDEARDQFKSTQIIEPGLSADGHFAGIIVPGAHSDVGGSYHRDGLSLRSGNLVINYLNGLTEAPQLKLQTERSNPDMYVIHDSEDHLAVYSTRYFNKHQERGMRHEAPAALCRPVEVCVPEPAAASLMAALPRYTVQVQTPPREPPMEPASPIALSPDVVVHDPLTQASPQPPPAPIPAEIDNAIRLRQQQQLQREEQRHTAGIQAATEQQATARTALDNGLLLTDPDHPAHEHYENARQGVVRVYSHQKQELDNHVEPMAASLVAQAQREGLSNINAVTLSADGQHLVASNTRDATAAHRETAQVPAAQAAHQSMADSSRQWAEQRIAQAQERIHTHTQAQANVQERMQVQEHARTYTPALQRAPAHTPAHTQEPQAAAPTMASAIDAQMQQATQQAQQMQQQALLHQQQAATLEREREERRREAQSREASYQPPSPSVATASQPHGMQPAERLPSLGTARPVPVADMRDPDHPGHSTYKDALQRVGLFESHQSIPSGEHSQRLAASLAVMTEREKLDLNRTFLEKQPNGHAALVEHARYGETGQRRFDIDLPALSSRPMAESSRTLAQLQSPHYLSQAPAAERTPEQAQALGRMSPKDQAMFTRIRAEAPAHISDEVVANAMLSAKQSGIHNADRIATVAMGGDRLFVAGTTPGFVSITDVSRPAPAIQESTQQLQAFNQQQALEQQQQQQQREEQQRSAGRSPSMSM